MAGRPIPSLSPATPLALTPTSSNGTRSASPATRILPRRQLASSFAARDGPAACPPAARARPRPRSTPATAPARLLARGRARRTWRGLQNLDKTTSRARGRLRVSFLNLPPSARVPSGCKLVPQRQPNVCAPLLAPYAPPPRYAHARQRSICPFPARLPCPARAHAPHARHLDGALIWPLPGTCYSARPPPPGHHNPPPPVESR